MKFNNNLLIIIFYATIIFLMPISYESLNCRIEDYNSKLLAHQTQSFVLKLRGGKQIFPIMSCDEAIGIINSVYGKWNNPECDILDSELGLKLPYQKLAAQSGRSVLFGVRPELYGITQADLNIIEKNGLIDYVQFGGVLPPDAFISDYSQKIGKFFSENKKSLNTKAAYRGMRAIVVHDNSLNQVLIFTPAAKELWISGTLSSQEMDWYLQTGSIGSLNSIPPGTARPK